ncbi:MAG: hypothetical protein IJ261_05870, partial [Clostridia bacterium]|nr:hypothetical protein [Clostridia bacterium]
KFIGLLGSSESSDLTLRSSDLPCRDVDEDGIIEIPLRRPLSESINSDTSLGYLLVWCKVKNLSLKPSEYYVVNALENYTLYFPTTWLNKVYVKSDNAARTWNFVNATDETLFSITAYDFENWDENSSEVTEMLMVQNDTVYCCTVTSEGKNAGVSAVDLIEYFSLNI